MEQIMKKTEKQIEYNEYMRGYMKEWRKQNTEKIKEYSKKSYEKNKEYYHNYYLNYYQDHKKQYKKTSKEWHDKNKSSFIYFHIGKSEEFLYIGSTGRNLSERQSAHFTNNSNLNMDIEEYVSKHGLNFVLYKDFEKYDLNRDDLYYLEFYFKQVYKEVLGKKQPPYNKEKLSRTEEELQLIGEQEEFKEFNLEKYLSKIG